MGILTLLPVIRIKDVWVWLESHGTDVGTEDAKTVHEALKDIGISVVGAAGMCWGGKSLDA